MLTVVAATQSFSDAALQLNLSQSSVSSAIASLENELGVVLFQRGRFGARLTPLGAEVLAYAQQMIMLQDEIYKTAQRARSLHSGYVRITSFRSITTHVLSGVMAQFRQRFPQVEVSILEQSNNHNIENDLRQGRADLGFVDYPLDEQFKTWDLLQDEYVVLLPSSFHLSTSRPTWQDLSQYPYILYSRDDSHDKEILAYCSGFGTTLNVEYWIKADSSIVSMVAQGLGATIMPRLAAEPIPENVQVYSLPVPLSRTVQVAVLADALLSPPVFAFLELLKSSIPRPKPVD